MFKYDKSVHEHFQVWYVCTHDIVHMWYVLMKIFNYDMYSWKFPGTKCNHEDVQVWTVFMKMFKYDRIIYIHENHMCWS